MRRKVLSWVLVVMLMAAIVGCSSNEPAETDSSKSMDEVDKAEDLLTTDVDENEVEGYAYGAGVTFHSEEPVSYSMMFSDHENYPYQDDWRIFSAIKELTNVDLTEEMNLIARTDYEDKKSILINTGDAPYIIPKTYDESAYVDGGQIVAISDWVQYMPNYQKAVEEWGMASDLKTKLQANGKYYVLPGMWETAGGGYSYIIRKDVFEAAGVDVVGNEGNWTYEDFYEAMKKVKEYTGADYVFSDRFFGDSTLNIAAVEYGVTGGWGLANGLKFDQDSESFYFANTTDAFKDYVTFFNKLMEEKIMDPESFSQEDDTAMAKFYKGDTYVINGGYQNLTNMLPNMQVDGELYEIVQPGGPAGMLQIENSRLENGVMISQNALDELGEEEFIKMLRFVDWLWYSDEGQTLSLWGVEGETYTRDADGTIVLNEDISYNGINQDTATKKLNVDYGFGGGVFAYGGSYDLRTSKMTEGEIDFNNRIQDTREIRPLDPPIMGNEEETEEMNLIKTPLMDYVSTMTKKFITGQADIEAEWDAYVAECENLGKTRYVDMANEIFNNTKGILGY